MSKSQRIYEIYEGRFLIKLIYFLVIFAHHHLTTTVHALPIVKDKLLVKEIVEDQFSLNIKTKFTCMLLYMWLIMMTVKQMM